MQLRWYSDGSIRWMRFLLTRYLENDYLVDKDDLIKRVWPDTFVEEGNLNKNIFLLRKVLGQQDGGLEYIETVPKCGYRFAAPVRMTADTGSGSQLLTPYAANRIGKKVSHYRALELIGGGGMG